jgi:hypothetical protein
MVRLVHLVLVVCLAAAVAGSIVTGLFWLTVVAMAGALGAGAEGVSLRLRRLSGPSPAPAER